MLILVLFYVTLLGPVSLFQAVGRRDQLDKRSMWKKESAWRDERKRRQRSRTCQAVEAERGIRPRDAALSRRRLEHPGISAFYHDSAGGAARRRKLVAAAHEGALHAQAPRSGAARAGGQVLPRGRAGLSIDDLDYVVFYDKPFVKFERILMTYIATFPRSLPSFAKSMRCG
jgi:carbamoyltransferase